MTVLSRRALLALLGAGATGAAVTLAPVGAAVAADTPRRSELTELERRDRTRLLTVVTKSRPLDPIDYEPDDLVRWRDPAYELRAEVADQLERLFAAADDDSLGLRVISAYRSYRTQAGTYEFWVRTHGQAAADVTSARPGHSEHQTGLAVDLDGTSGGCYLQPCFGQTPTGRWVARNAHTFGFVLSYPRDLKHRTGYAYEPWHIRYVGPQVAWQMNQFGVPLLSDYLQPHVTSAGLGATLGEPR